MYYDVLCTWKLFVLYFGGWTLQNEVFFNQKKGHLDSGYMYPGKSKSTKLCRTVVRNHIDNSKDDSLFGLGLSGCISILIKQYTYIIYYRIVNNHPLKHHVYWTFYPCHLSHVNRWLMGTRLNRPSTCSRTPLFFFLTFRFSHPQWIAEKTVS